MNILSGDSLHDSAYLASTHKLDNEPQVETY